MSDSNSVNPFAGLGLSGSEIVEGLRLAARCMPPLSLPMKEIAKFRMDLLKAEFGWMCVFMPRYWQWMRWRLFG